MNNRTHLGEELQTTCTHCNSTFRINSEQLDAARGRARCSQCMRVFNALTNLENYSGLPIISTGKETPTDDSQPKIYAHTEAELSTVAESVSLRDAMYGENHTSRHSLKPVLWFIGILLLITLCIVQFIYYQRYQLISSSKYQNQVLSLCQYLPCDESRFSNPSQIRMIERNVFSHPTRDKALMITGSFINDAPFDQSMPGLLISLSDIKGNLIANRLFTAQEYLTDKSRERIPAGKMVQFKLEISDPGAEALTYEFEFVS